jgi:hypothetical protein
MSRTAAECAGLPRLSTVEAKALADAAQVSVETIWRRCRLWEENPADPRALPYVRSLGRPYRIRRSDAVRFLMEVGV